MLLFPAEGKRGDENNFGWRRHSWKCWRFHSDPLTILTASQRVENWSFESKAMLFGKMYCSFVTYLKSYNVSLVPPSLSTKRKSMFDAIVHCNVQYLSFFYWQIALLKWMAASTSSSLFFFSIPQYSCYKQFESITSKTALKTHYTLLYSTLRILFSECSFRVLYVSFCIRFFLFLEFLPIWN